MSLDASSAVIACLAALAALAFVDGVLVHLVRERLHRRPETRFDHLLHTGCPRDPEGLRAERGA